MRWEHVLHYGMPVGLLLASWWYDDKSSFHVLPKTDLGWFFLVAGAATLLVARGAGTPAPVVRSS